MAGVPAEPLLIAVGVIVVAAFGANLLFRATRIPDIILLIGLGVVLGPVSGVVRVELFESIAPFIGTVALIVILFEGGLKIHWSELRGGVAQGALLAVLVFVATSLLGSLIAMVFLHLSASLSLLLGMSLGGAGAVIVIPLIRELDVSPRAQTIVSIEAAVSDVLVVLGVVGLSTALDVRTDTSVNFAAHLVQNFSIGIVMGIAAGFAWTVALRMFQERSFEYVLTTAILFLLYVACEYLQGSGPLAVLLFGLVIGNSRKTKRLAEGTEIKVRSTKRTWEYAPVFSGELMALHHEVIFFLRAFFFVTLGVVLDLTVFQRPSALLVGGCLALAVMGGRWWGAQISLRRAQLTPWDRRAISFMFPLGLAAAVVSLVPSTRFDIPGSEEFGTYAAVAIVLTNVSAAALVFATSRPEIRARLESHDRGKPLVGGSGRRVSGDKR